MKTHTIKHTKIDEVEGGSGRVPTGVLQFKNDWPGYFIRGDDVEHWQNVLNAAKKECTSDGVIKQLESFITQFKHTYDTLAQ